jgi:prepilin-type N-terminal cleavage/methylation domain-containing protein
MLPAPRIPVASPRAFTLIELILVMALLTVVMALISPALGGFLRGRGLDSEARRFISLTHYAQARAVSEGIPMRLWIDPVQRRYGLSNEYNFSVSGEDPRAVDYPLGPDLEIEVDPRSWASLNPLILDQSILQNRWAGGQPDSANGSRIVLRFHPDGSIDETSPIGVWLRRQPANSTSSRRGRVEPRDEVHIAQSQTRLRYEVQTNAPFSSGR